jgi:hypothetical protein
MGRQIETHSTKQRIINNNSTVTHWHKCGTAVERGSLRRPSWGIISLRAGKTQSPITLKMEAICSPKHRFLLEPHRVISQKTFVIVTTLKPSQKIAISALRDIRVRKPATSISGMARSATKVPWCSRAVFVAAIIGVASYGWWSNVTTFLL